MFYSCVYLSCVIALSCGRVLDGYPLIAMFDSEALQAVNLTFSNLSSFFLEMKWDV